MVVVKKVQINRIILIIYPNLGFLFSGSVTGGSNPPEAGVYGL